MKKYSICSYAICKNEEKFAERWYKSVSEADLVVVGDTGSDDNTVGILRDLGALVYKLDIKKFRFDHARNKCLEMIPKDIDICVSSDLDEIITSDWHKKLQTAWDNDTTRASCKYVWSYNEDGSEGLIYKYQRIHSKNNYKWIYPTHEVLLYTGNIKEKEVFVEGMIYNHYPDTNKNRSFNLELLELAVKEYPLDSRNYYYLGREYYFAKKLEQSINTLSKYLNLPNSLWVDERASAMRYISKAYKELKNYNKSKKWILSAIAEQPYTRDGYIEMALLLNEIQDWLGVYYYTKEALKITNRDIAFTSEANSWNHIPYDLLAASCYWLGNKKEAISSINTALQLLPNDDRLLKNKEYIIKMPD